MLTIVTSDVLKDLDVTAAEFQLRHILFFSLFSCSILYSGKLSDASPEWLFYCGLGIFVTGCATIIVAARVSSWPIYLVGNALQAVADGIVVAGIMALIGKHYNDSNFGWAFGIFGSALSAASLIGPGLGGLFSVAGWSFSYVFLALLALISLSVVYRRLGAEESASLALARVCWPPLTPYACIFLGLLGFQSLLAGTALTPYVGAAFGVAVACAVMFKSAVLAPVYGGAIRRNLGFQVATLRSVLLSVSGNAVFFTFPLVMRNLYGLTAFDVSVLITVEALIPIVFSLYAGHLADRRRWLPIIAGIAFSMAGYGSLVVLGVSSPFVQFAIFFAAASLGAAFIVPAQEALVARYAPSDSIGEYMGIFNFFVFCSSSLGVALLARGFDDGVTEAMLVHILQLGLVMGVLALITLMVEIFCINTCSSQS